MKEPFLLVGFIIAAIVGLFFVLLMNNITTTDQHNYYLLKEVTEAAMVDSVDYAYYRKNGTLRIYREKFVENFLRRWSEVADSSKEYDIKFYDIMESPPKASVEITTKEKNLVDGKNSDDKEFSVVNRLDYVLETSLK
ncbi:MAG: DUF5411 family protein [Bacilli bacterium]